MFKLGKTSARPGAVKLRLRDFMTKKKVTVPDTFGHEAAIADWGMLGNDQYGCCVWAGGGHETMIWCGEASTPVAFSTENTLKDYAKVTGFTPGDPSTDQGTDMELAAKFRRKTGLLDARGKRHKVGAYLDLTPGDINEHLLAAYLFGAVGIGIEFPTSAMDQFNAGQPWDVVRGAKLDGGHYVPVVAHRGNIVVVTWGKCQQMTPAFFKKYNDESVAYLSTEMLKAGRSPEGFDLQALKDALAAL